jgi:hypothetical protein
MASLATVWGAANSRGLQQGRFDVLMGLRMPGALVELGFLDHPVEGPALTDRARLVRLAAALARAVLRFAAAAHGLSLPSGAHLGGGPAQAPQGDRPRDRRRPAPGELPLQRPAKPAVAFDTAA